MSYIHFTIPLSSFMFYCLWPPFYGILVVKIYRSTISSSLRSVASWSSRFTASSLLTLAALLKTVKGMVNDDRANSTIPVYNVTSRNLEMVIEWWNKHEISTFFDEKELKEWESRFLPIYQCSDRSKASDLLIYDVLIDEICDVLIVKIYGILVATSAALPKATLGFKEKETVATQLQTIKGMVDDNCASSTIPICNVTGRILAMVIEWWNKHKLASSLLRREGVE
ncbi:hypothetical protein Dsin_002801 [Dipteronia sinensis]|uniref:SKP1 component POZ domain-containing protein n=1 Tax=Dipteronia sinensis TaxID=43782 RepID=A0AAE0ELK4_9ROSI|nr:hypothetical protein Dsin_002801 [Dipteronia sinensis]